MQHLNLPKNLVETKLFLTKRLKEDFINAFSETNSDDELYENISQMLLKEGESTSIYGTGKLYTFYRELYQKSRLNVNLLSEFYGYSSIIPNSLQDNVSLFVRNGRFIVPEGNLWKNRLENNVLLEKALQSVGQIQYESSDTGKVYKGTGWVLGDEKYIVTNFHVAKRFTRYARHEGSELVFNLDILQGDSFVTIDFLKERRNSAQKKFVIHEIVPIEQIRRMDGTAHDICLLKVHPSDTNQLPEGLKLESENIQEDQAIAVVGYPQKVTGDYIQCNFNEDRLAQRFCYGNTCDLSFFDVKRIAPGSVKTINADTFEHNASTLDGNSGSGIFDLNTGNVIGLHYAGCNHVRQNNIAISAQTIQRILNNL